MIMVVILLLLLLLLNIIMIMVILILILMTINDDTDTTNNANNTIQRPSALCAFAPGCITSAPAKRVLRPTGTKSFSCLFLPAVFGMCMFLPTATIARSPPATSAASSCDNIYIYMYIYIYIHIHIMI